MNNRHLSVPEPHTDPRLPAPRAKYAPALILLLSLLLLPTGCGPSPESIEDAEYEAVCEIEALLEAQGADWSRGDIEAFTSIYSDDCLYISPSGMAEGRKALTELYRQRYPGPEAMGNLSLQILEMRPAFVSVQSFLGLFKSEDIGGMSIVARWTLTYPDSEPGSGLTLIVFRRIGGEWKIVQDASM